MSVWVYNLVSVWVSEWLFVSFNEYVSECLWVSVYVNECVSKLMSMGEYIR